jgi:transposase
VRGYEAGRDGFWRHRFFVRPGVETIVVDSASIAVNRCYRLAQTARLDVPKLRTMLVRHAVGEKKVWRVGRVPRVLDEDRRPLPQARLPTKRDRTRVLQRIQGLLAGGGIRMGLQGDVGTQLDAVRQWAGAPLPAALRASEA